MSIRDEMRKNALIKTKNNPEQTTGRSLRATKNSTIAKPSDRATSALRKASAISGPRSGRMVYALDATGSRGPAWEEAKIIQGKMFARVASVGKMSMRLMHYGGGNLSDNGWNDNTNKISMTMDSISCIGGATQLNHILSTCAQDIDGEKAQSILFIGDHFEEDATITLQLARDLARKKIKVFCCHDIKNGDSAALAAKPIFEEISRLTGGKYFRFGENMPLDEICENIALLTIGGRSAVKKLGRGKSAQLLLTSASKTPPTYKP